MLWNVIFTTHSDDEPVCNRQVYADNKMEAKEEFRRARKHDRDYILSITEVDFDLM